MMKIELSKPGTKGAHRRKKMEKTILEKEGMINVKPNIWYYVYHDKNDNWFLSDTAPKRIEKAWIHPTLKYRCTKVAFKIEQSGSNNIKAFYYP